MFSGVFFTILYTASMACLNLAVKLSNIDVTTIMFCRYNIALALTLPLIPYIFKRNCSLLLHVLRGLSIFMANFFTYYGHKNAPFITANLIGMTEPIFVLIISSFLSKKQIINILAFSINCFRILFRQTKILPSQIEETLKKIHSKHPFSKKIIIGLILGYIGIMLLIFQKDISAQDGTLLGTISILIANILSASFVFISKYLTQKETIPTMIIYTTLILWCCGWFIKPDFNIFYSFSQTQILLLVFIGFIAISGHFFAISGLSKLSPEKYSPILYTRIIFGTLIGYLVFNEIITLWQIVGASLIIFGLYIINKTQNKVS